MNLYKNSIKKANFAARLFVQIVLILSMAGILVLERFVLNLPSKPILITLIIEVLSLFYITWEMTDGLD